MVIIFNITIFSVGRHLVRQILSGGPKEGLSLALRGMGHERFNAASTDGLQQQQLFSDVLERIAPPDVVFITWKFSCEPRWTIWRVDMGNIGTETEKKVVRDEADQDSDWEGDCADRNGDGPLGRAKAFSREGAAAEGDNEDLAPDCYKIDDKKERVAGDAFKDIEFVVEAAIVELIEDLHPDVDVEDKGFEMALLILGIVAEDFIASEIED